MSEDCTRQSSVCCLKTLENDLIEVIMLDIVTGLIGNKMKLIWKKKWISGFRKRQWNGEYHLYDTWNYSMACKN